jgi:NAD(P)-dependent dehydrogenase (short-subunit alcohol dehydrogenase family)
MKLHNERNIIITGASSGIGRALAIKLAEEGARLFLIGRDEEKLISLLNEIKGQNHQVFCADIAQTEKIATLIAEIALKSSSIEGFVHCAGVLKPRPFKLTPPASYLEHYQINVIAGLEIARCLVKTKLVIQNGASFVFMSSLAGIMGVPSQVAYAASKGALIAATKSMAIELAPIKVRVNCISPGMVSNTKMSMNLIRTLSDDWATKNQADYPLGWAETEDVADTITFLLSDNSKKITGINITLDGGFSLK